MYVRTDEVKNQYTRKSKLGNEVKYHRTKQIHVFRCDECSSEFKRDSRYMTSRRNNEYKHFCQDCKFAASKIGQKNRKKRLDQRIGERWVDSSGYVIIRLASNSPYRGARPGQNYSYIREHVKVMQDHVGRKLTKTEVVHHIDGDKTNNSIENLDLCTKRQHNKCHATSEEIVFELYKRGLVGYDDRTKRYFLRDSGV
jgi:hypothetical protein